jgi:acyl-CoA hydrolase
MSQAIPTRPREVVMRFLAEPADVNFGGKVHGGMVMKWIDQAGYACAVSWSSQYCVTVYVGGTRFYKPIHIGHLVEVRARLIHTGRTSMHIAVDVSATDPRSGITKKTTHCTMVFVALDLGGDPIAVPRWEPATDEDRSLERHALHIAEMAKNEEQELRAIGEAQPHQPHDGA